MKTSQDQSLSFTSLHVIACRYCSLQLHETPHEKKLQAAGHNTLQQSAFMYASEESVREYRLTPISVFTSTSTLHSNIYHVKPTLIVEDGTFGYVSAEVNSEYNCEQLTQEASDQQEGSQVAFPRAHQGTQVVGIQEAYCEQISIQGLDKGINKDDIPGGRHSRRQSTCGRESWGHSRGKTGGTSRESRRGSSISHRSSSHRAGSTYSSLLSIPATNRIQLLGKRTSTKGHPSSSGHALTRTWNQTGLLFSHGRRTFDRN